MPGVPDRLYIGGKDRTLYEQLDNEELLRSKGGRRNRKEQFFFAMAIGFKNGLKRPLETRNDLFLSKDLQPDDEALLNAVAVYDTGSVSVLSNKGEVYKIAEEYAHGGIKLLCDKMDSTPYGSFDKQLEKQLRELYDKISSEKK